MESTYSVNGKGFDKFSEATKYAQSENANVIENANGKTRWSPAPSPDKKKWQMYRERLAAYRPQARENLVKANVLLERAVAVGDKADIAKAKAAVAKAEKDVAKNIAELKATEKKINEMK